MVCFSLRPDVPVFYSETVKEAAMKDNAQAMVMASFTADSLALGAHWIYNTNVIDRKVGRVEKLLKPIVKSWHPTKERGEFTHYGDQTLVLLESVARRGQFDIDDFAAAWRRFFKDYDGYIDKSTTATLENFAAGKSPMEAGADSEETGATDLGGAARIAPLGYLYRNDPDRFLDAARRQTIMTHNHPVTIASALFFAHVAISVLGGESPVAAIRTAAGRPYENAPIAEWVNQGLDSIADDTRKTIIEFGQMCEIEASFPATIHLIAKYENDLRAALIENVMAGGDSSARGLMTGMVLGAYLGPAAIPGDWLADLKARGRITALLAEIDRNAQPPDA